VTDDIRILFVDDEIRILETFPVMLRERGFFIKTASGKDEALSLITGERFNLVFLDQNLGQTKGMDLMQMMSEIDPDLYFVIITAYDSTDLAVGAMKKGASDFITKPFFISDLLKSIGYVEKKMQLNTERNNLLLTLESKVNEKTEQLRGIYFSVLSSLAEAMEKRDTGTYGHCRRVSYCSRLIAVALDLDDGERRELKAAAMLHDIGKIGISDFILGKQGPLNDDEKDIIKNHPQNGVEILKPLKQFESILPAILHHHESYDGSGYPDGLAGEDIPLHARIIAVADTYDAIMSTRPYRFAADHDKAIHELLTYAGRQFDKEVVNAFVEANRKYRDLYIAPDISATFHQA